MCIIQIFNDYMEGYHPHLMKEDWKADVRNLTEAEVSRGDIQSLLPTEKKGEIKCWYFYYDDSFADMVFLLQDKRGVNNLAISLLQNGTPVCPITFR